MTRELDEMQKRTILPLNLKLMTGRLSLKLIFRLRSILNSTLT